MQHQLHQSSVFRKPLADSWKYSHQISDLLAVFLLRCIALQEIRAKRNLQGLVLMPVLLYIKDKHVDGVCSPCMHTIHAHAQQSFCLSGSPCIMSRAPAEIISSSWLPRELFLALPSELGACITYFVCAELPHFVSGMLFPWLSASFVFLYYSYKLWTTPVYGIYDAM